MDRSEPLGRDDDRRCTARSKRSGDRCKRYATPGMRVCRFHGGKTPAGIASPHYRHGRYSAVLPAGLLDAYERAVADPDLLSTRHEAALLQSRIAELVGSLRDGRHPDSLWPKVQAAWDAVGDARRRKDAPALFAAGAEMDALLAEGVKQSEQWDGIVKTALAFDRLATSERRRLEQMQSLVRAEDAALFASALLSTVTRHVRDPAVLRAIQTEMLAVMNQHRPTA